jgi:sortase (surface protein transpeptidase)
MSDPARGRVRRSRILGAAAAVLVIAGVIAIVVAVRAQRSAPQPPQSAASPIHVVPREPSSGSQSSTPQRGTKARPHRAPAVHGPVLARSRPIQLSIPTIGVNTTLKTTGLTSSGLIQTPPLARDSHAYWLRVSPTPGELGPATIIGHVDSAAYGPAVFFKLGALRQRDMITIRRADGTVAVFEVERVVEYPKKQFPTHAVYGNTDDAALRLITCGGTFNSTTHNYESNIVVYAAMVSVRHRS